MAENPCSVFSQVDRLVLWNLINRNPNIPIFPGDLDILFPRQDGPRLQSVTTGTLVEATDVFRFRAFGTAGVIPVTFFGRVQHASGQIIPFAHVLTTDATGTIFETLPMPGPGLLLGAAASVPVDSITTGYVSAIAEIGRGAGAGFVPHTLLFTGQLDDLTPLTSQSPPPAVPTGRSQLFVHDDLVGGATPFTFLVTPSPGRRYRFTRVRFELTCSAAVGTRTPILLFRRGTSSFQAALFTVSRGAGQNGVYEASISGSLSTVGNFSAQPLAPDLYFYEPISVEIETYATFAGDIIAPFFVRWEES